MHSATNPVYSLYDSGQNFLAPITDFEQSTIVWKWGVSAGTGTIVIPGEPTDFMSDVLNVDESPVLVSVRSSAPRPWTGRVHNAEYTDDGDGPRLELTLVDDRIWLSAMLALVNPAGTPNEQGTRESDDREGPLETVVLGYIRDAAARLRLPMIVASTPQPDGSPYVKLSARMTSLSSLIETALDEHGYGVTVSTYRTGDPVPDGIGTTPTPGTLIVNLDAPKDDPRLLWQQEQLQTFSVSAQEPNAVRAYVGGEGQGTERQYFEYVNQTLAETQGRYALPEVYVDASGTVTPESAGLDALRTNAGGKSVSFTVADANPWRHGIDWNIGDFAYARIAGQVFRSQILEVEMTETASDGVLFAPKCGPANLSDGTIVERAIARLIAEIRRNQARR